MSDLFEEIVRLRKEGVPAALATIVGTRGSTPGREAMRLLVRGDGTFLGTVGGGCLEAEVYECARRVMRSERPETLRFKLNEVDSPENGLLCGGEVTVFVEPLVTPTLSIFGGGHISRVLCHVAALAGFRVEVFEDREAFCTEERFPEARRLVHGDLRAGAREAPLGDTSYVVVVTRGHKGDGEVLAGLWEGGRRPRWLGMIGSKSKRVTLFRHLREDPGVPQDWLDRVRSPVGLAIGARSHEEIAVAIVAEMIQVRRGDPEPAPGSGEA
ncbi:MAG: XdhC/CoxI family protein [Planctomycetota bacterium]